MENDQAVALTQNEMATGLIFEREMMQAQAAMQQAAIGRNAFLAFLRESKGLPDDWQINDWGVGFEPPAE